MSKNTKRLQAAVVLLLTAVMLFEALTQGKDKPQAAAPVYQPHADRLILWYTDEGMTDYYTAIAVEYMEETGVSITPVLKSGIDYLEEVNDTAAEDKEMPDIFALSNAALSEAHILGLIDETPALSEYVNEDRFPETTIRAVTSRGRKVAYPIYYETAFLICNKSYLKAYAKDQIEANRAQEAADSMEPGAEPEDTEDATIEEVEEMAESYIPKDFSSLCEFADNYDAPDGVKAVLGWDTEDVFYNYYVLGESIDLAGEYGDDADSLNVLNDESIGCMREYKSLADFFSLTEENISYADIRDGFVRGEFVFAVVGSDVLPALDQAVSGGLFTWEYEICPLPQVIDSVKASPLSVTQTLCVNKKSKKGADAERFAQYAADSKRAKLLYDRAGHLMPAYHKGEIHYGDRAVQGEYEDSIPVPKLPVLSDFWMKVELAFMDVRAGENPNNVLETLEKSLK